MTKLQLIVSLTLGVMGFLFMSGTVEPWVVSTLCRELLTCGGG
jgi:hypothetical protein